jgi:hypothetical protein
MNFEVLNWCIILWSNFMFNWSLKWSNPAIEQVSFGSQ